jgi:uncharacterized protein (DUF433 family)
MTYDEAVSRDPEILSGALCFRGTRVPVKTLFDHLEVSQLAEFYEDFPGVSPEIVEAVVHEAGGCLNPARKSSPREDLS